MKKRPIFFELLKRLKEPRHFIQVLLGPRQVGKTTMATQAVEEVGIPTHYASADLATLQDLSWVKQQWETARQKANSSPRGAILMIDEVQKIPSWSELIKSLWDEDTKNKTKLSVLLLGSSPWLMQKGLTESLAGRFEILPVTHWSFSEMQESFGWSIDRYTFFGGYPGAAHLADEENQSRWMSYINDSLIETTLSRDILLMTQVNKPILLRRLFHLGASYSGQILSYTKMLGELAEAGNTTTLAHYLALLSGAGLLAGLEKLSAQPLKSRSSSPKLMVWNSALMSAQSNKAFAQAKQDGAYWGRLVESMIGAHLLNAIRGTQIELFYWREGNFEVDFVLRQGKTLIAIEVKSNHDPISPRGVDQFVTLYKPAKVLLVGEKGLPIEQFLKMPVKDFF